ncbi:MAG TPA: NUDIX domain-containing protein [Planctomycetota bacterium]|jgi:8-oxo-dGTP pyrophosphatase MutT (NUDIX family)
MTTEPEIHAAGAICYAREKKKVLFLLLRSAKHGEWGPPKGKAEPNETELETAMRELYEEAGLRRASFAADFRETLRYEVFKKGKTCPKEVIFFLCDMGEDEIRLSHEHTEAHLATMDEVEVLIPHEGLKEVFRNALKHIEKKC